MFDKPFSEACVENAPPILSVLKRVFAGCKTVLEIGSGTGQHAVYFAPHLPHLVWQTGDVPDYHYAIDLWLAEARLPNVLPPINTDARTDDWKSLTPDAIYSANTLHIMDWGAVEAFFAGAGRALGAGKTLLVYGPFHYHGKPTSESNARFDAMLRERDPASGVRDFVDVDALARAQGFAFVEDIAMPTNNRILVWRKT